MPLVSIITPVYNAARWLPETFATVRAQTFTDWEQILVDDGSTDNSLALVEAAAKEDTRSLSSYIEKLLTDHLKKKGYLKS